jgi:predicted ArsR family transcriptional regulator
MTAPLQGLNPGARWHDDGWAMGWLEAVADPVRLGIVRHLALQGPATLNELGAAVGAVPETVRRHIAHLSHEGVVEALERQADGETRGRPAVRYRLTADTLASLGATPGGVRRPASR